MKKVEIKTKESLYHLIDYDATDFDCVEYLDGLLIVQYESRIMLKHAKFCDTVKGDLVEVFNQIKEFGIHLFENPVTEPECLCNGPDRYNCNYIQEYKSHQEAEEKTFYKPIIIKIK